MAKPSAPAQKTPAAKPGPKARAAKPFTGVAYSLEASKDQGFNNFRICMLFLVKGELIHMERTQEFASFEAKARTEVLIDSSIWNLNSRYRNGDFQSLGGDARDELVNRLKKTNPDLLDRIRPALEGTS